MNRILKIILVIINTCILAIAVCWFLEKKEPEPLIVCLGQVATLIALFFEKGISRIITRNITNNSDVDIDVQSGDQVKASNVDKSKVHIKTRK